MQYDTKYVVPFEADTNKHTNMHIPHIVNFSLVEWEARSRPWPISSRNSPPATRSRFLLRQRSQTLVIIVLLLFSQSGESLVDILAHLFLNYAVTSYMKV